MMLSAFLKVPATFPTQHFLNFFILSFLKSAFPKDTPQWGQIVMNKQFMSWLHQR